MSHGNDQRCRALAKTAFRLKQQGYTTRQIAQQLGLKPEVVKTRVLLGERLSQEVGESNVNQSTR